LHQHSAFFEDRVTFSCSNPDSRRQPRREYYSPRTGAAEILLAQESWRVLALLLSVFAIARSSIQFLFRVLTAITLALKDAAGKNGRMGCIRCDFALGLRLNSQHTFSKLLFAFSIRSTFLATGRLGRSRAGESGVDAKHIIRNGFITTRDIKVPSRTS
jgi:hypothetical protein